MRARLGYEGEDPGAWLTSAQHDGQHRRADAVAQDGAAGARIGTRVVQGQLFGTTKEVGIVGKLILQGFEILWLEWKGAHHAGEVVDAALTPRPHPLTSHTSSL